VKAELWNNGGEREKRKSVYIGCDLVKASKGSLDKNVPGGTGKGAERKIILLPMPMYSSGARGSDLREKNKENAKGAVQEFRKEESEKILAVPAGGG